MREVDARGLACPEPVLALRAAIADLPPGAQVRLLATDPLSAVDVAAWCARTGHRLLAEQTERAPFEFLIERA